MLFKSKYTASVKFVNDAEQTLYLKIVEKIIRIPNLLPKWLMIAHLVEWNDFKVITLLLLHYYYY